MSAQHDRAENVRLKKRAAELERAVVRVLSVPVGSLDTTTPLARALFGLAQVAQEQGLLAKPATPTKETAREHADDDPSRQVDRRAGG